MSMPPPPLLDQPVTARRKLMTPRNRFFWWYLGALLLTGPFGFLVGPFMARRGTRRVERLYPAEARVAQARDKGFAWWQWWAMTILTLMGAVGAMTLISGLPMFLLVLYSKLMIPQP